MLLPFPKSEDRTILSAGRGQETGVVGETSLDSADDETKAAFSILLAESLRHPDRAEAVVLCPEGF